MNAQCIEMEYLAMVMGGTLDEATGAIKVTKDAPSKGYVLAGTFNGKKHGDNSNQVFEMILYNVAPQPNVDLTLNATDIGSFPLVLDVLQDENGDIALLTPKTV